MFFSKDQAVRAISHPVSPPSITIPDCPSGSVNKRNLVAFHDRSSWINSVINRTQFTTPEAGPQWLNWACFSNTAEANTYCPACDHHNMEGSGLENPISKKNLDGYGAPIIPWEKVHKR